MFNSIVNLICKDYRKIFSSSCSGIFLLFHRIRNQERNSIGAYENMLPVVDFENIINHLAKTYEIISIDKYVEHINNNNQIDNDFVLISFDDGYMDTYSTAIPILEKYKAPAIIYITTEFTDEITYPYEYILSKYIQSNNNVSYFWNGEKHNFVITDSVEKKEVYEKLKLQLRPLNSKERNKLINEIIDEPNDYMDSELFMKWEHINSIRINPLITIGSHTASHQQLDLISDDEIHHEIKTGKSILEENIGKLVEHFAYPYGGYNNNVKTIVRKYGFKTAVTTNPYSISCKNIDMMEIARFDVIDKKPILGANKVKNIHSA